jgi:hypothetical protein
MERIWSSRSISSHVMPGSKPIRRTPSRKRRKEASAPGPLEVDDLTPEATSNAHLEIDAQAHDLEGAASRRSRQEVRTAWLWAS